MNVPRHFLELFGQFREVLPIVSAQCEYPLAESKLIFHCDGFVVFTAIAPDYGVVPDDEMALASSISPDRWKDRDLIALPVESPCLVGPRVKIDGELLPTSIGAQHHERSRNSSMS